MDISKKYIDQCRKAGDIQNLWKCENGDFFYDFKDRGLESVQVWHSGRPVEYDLGFMLWLPRQDQLQEIVAVLPTWTDTRPMNLQCRFHDWWLRSMVRDNFRWMYQDDFISLEMYWLAFTMDLRFGKWWNGTEWCEYVAEFRDAWLKEQAK